MASDFFSIVALVVALSAAAFTLIITIREMTKESVSRMQERADAFNAAVFSNGSTSLKALARVGNLLFVVGHWAWRLSLLTPIIVFAIYSWISTDQVLESHRLQQMAKEVQAPASPVTPPAAAATSPPVETPKIDHWFAVCGDCQMEWLWWTRRLAAASVTVAFIATPAMWFGVWILSLLSSSLEEKNKIKPAAKPNRPPKRN